MFSQTSTSVSITYGNTGKNVFDFFYKITRRKLKRGSSLLYQSVNSPYCSWWRMRWRIMAWTFPCFPYSYRNTAFNQSKLTFSKCYFIIQFSKNVLVYYCKCCNLIGYATGYLFVNRYRVAATSNTTRPSFSEKSNAYSLFLEIILKK